MAINEVADMEISAISGTSIASIIAALYAQGASVERILHCLKTYAKQFSQATFIKGGAGSKVIQTEVDAECGYKTFADINKPIYISANVGGLWNTKLFVFSKETTPSVTLGEACRASCSFPFLYEHFKMSIDEKKYSFWDGGMIANSYVIRQENALTVISSFRTTHVNNYSRYADAWRDAEKSADVVIKPFVGDMKTLGDENETQKAFELGYIAAKRGLGI